MSRRTRVGIPAEVFMAWPGGVDFIVHLANALALNSNLKVYFLAPSSTDHLEIRLDNQWTHHVSISNMLDHARLQVFKPSNMQQAVKAIKNQLHYETKVIYYDNTIEGFMSCIKILKLDVVGPTTDSFGPYFPVAWLGYIWDFQHKYLPEFFTKAEIKSREKVFKDTLKEAPAIIVNSEDVKNDSSKFYKKINRDKIVALPFAPEPQIEWFDIDLNEVKKKYLLPKKYFIVSNQFWLHKSHTTAINAMAVVLKDSQYKDIHLICTGKMEEPRRPEYIEQIKNLVSKLGVKKNIHFLGYIPKLDQVGIMRQALAVIQPTIFEGGRGGGAANDAIALGVPLIVSDIRINQELTGPDISFFRAGSASDLATKIKDFLKKSPKPPSRKSLLHNAELNKRLLAGSLEQSVMLAQENFYKSINQ